MGRRTFNWRIVLAVLGVLGAGVLAAAVWWAWKPSAEVNLGDVAAVTLAAGTVVSALTVWARRSAPAATTIVDVDRAAQVLAGLVEQQWRAEARHRLLEDPEPIPVHWQLSADETIMSPAHLICAETEFDLSGRSDDVARLAAHFRALKRRRMVITGEAGMGKTTLAVQLLLHLLITREADRAAAAHGEIVPVPVLLPVSGWDTATHPRLQDWIAVRLAQDYPALAAPQLGPGAAAALADGGHILPILDGLDEIPDDARTGVIEALNASLTARDQLILTSRTDEFTKAIDQVGRPLTAAAVIIPSLLTPDAAADYLTACLPSRPPPAWQKTLTALRSQATAGLTELAATPLGLWLIRTVYLAPGTDPAPLTGSLGRDAEALRAHLFDQLIPALITARPPSTDPADLFRPRHRLDPRRTRRYLSYLAHAFPPATTRDIAWWHIARTTPDIRSLAPRAVGFLVGSVAMVGGGLGPGLMVRDGFGLGLGILAGLGAGLGFGLVAGLGVGFVAESWIDGTPGYASLRSRTPLARIIKNNLADGLTARLEGGLGLVLGISAGVVAMVGGGFEFVIGLAAGFRGGLELVAGFLVGVVALAGGGLAVRLGGGLGLVLGILAGVVAMVGGGLMVEFLVGHRLEAGLEVGLVAGLGVGFVAWAWNDGTPGYAGLGRRSPLVRTIKNNLADGLTVGVGGGCGLGLVVGITIGTVAGFVAGLAAGAGFGLGVGLLFGLIKWAEQPILTASSTPRSTWRSDRTLTLIRTLVFGVTFGCGLGLMVGVGFGFGPAGGLVAGVVSGLMFGLMFGLGGGGHHAWLACMIAVVRLALAQRLPLRIMDFLEDAHRLGLLRAVGPVHQFRHAALHDHLAAAYGRRPVTPEEP